MLTGKSIHLRPVRQVDLEELFDQHSDITNRGEFFPVGFLSEREFRRRFDEDGFWAENQGVLLMVDRAGCIVGQIEFFKTVSYLDELELSYQIYAQADRGQGYATQAVDLLVRYLFARLKVNRIRLIIHPGNRASCRVAEKCGFTLESVARGAWYHQGVNHDVNVFAILRADVSAVREQREEK
jgi:[ribosomal protein S5]-alanine N-acetyltransferase